MTNEKRELFATLGLIAEESVANESVNTALEPEVELTALESIESELKDLEEIVSMYLDYAENQAKRKILMKMNDWIQKLDSFLSFNEYGVLKDAGKVSAEVAKQLALKEYSKFSIIQDKTYISDFDLLIKESESSNQL